ncbi:MAG: alpha/beta fold hydrolase [Planctomycetota bacterium]|nr:MAG: alpha/beta fold hydrolase [Planctomycetota bacterium]
MMNTGIASHSLDAQRVRALAVVAGILFTAGPPVALAGLDERAPVPPSARAEDLGVPFDRYVTTDALGRAIPFYLTPIGDGAPPAPIVLWIQGSGCDSHFTRTPDGQVGGGLGMMLLGPLRGRARLLVVEKPGVEFLAKSATPGASDGCGDAFLEEYAADRWAEALRAALDAALAMPGVSKERVLVAGHSEGAVMAAHLASMDARVTHVGMISGSGVSQIFDMAMLAARSAGSPEDRAGRVEGVYETFARMLDEPDRIDRWAWGHTYKRWASFSRVSPVVDLAATQARVFLAYGDADQSVSVEGNDALRAELLARGQAARVERIAGGDHSLARPGEPPFQRMSSVLAQIVEWFLGT